MQPWDGNKQDSLFPHIGDFVVHKATALPGYPQYVLRFQMCLLDQKLKWGKAPHIVGL